MPFVTTADAVDREAAFLVTTGDGLPPLLVADGGRWDLVQAYLPRTAATRKNQIFVTRSKLQLERTALIRTMPHYMFTLHLMWTLAAASGSAETEQRNFDLAVNDLVMRVKGTPPPQTDKTHGGRFLSVAENPPQIDVEFVEPAPFMGPGAAFAAVCTYAADDFDFPD